MTEERKHAILFAATILAARKLNDSESKPSGIHVAITDAIDKANLLLEKIHERWPTESGSPSPARQESPDKRLASEP